MNYDQHAEWEVRGFERKHGKIAFRAVEAFNEVDPYSCLYTPNEYLDNARSFVEMYANCACYLEEPFSEELIYEMVRHSFSPCEIVQYISEEKLRLIAHFIHRPKALRRFRQEKQRQYDARWQLASAQLG